MLTEIVEKISIVEVVEGDKTIVEVLQRGAQGKPGSVTISTDENNQLSTGTDGGAFAAPSITKRDW